MKTRTTDHVDNAAAGNTPTLVIGLTGGIASGKTAVAQILASLGVCVVDADEVSRDLVAPGQPALSEIVAEFGQEVVTPEGKLDRAKMREKVFESPAGRRRLEQILHPRVCVELQRRASEADGPYCVLAVPLLIEAGLQHLVHRVLVVEAPEEVRIQRALERDGSSRTTIEGIVRAQMTRAERSAQADDIIENDGDLAALKRQVVKLHAFYLKLSGTHLPAAGN